MIRTGLSQSPGSGVCAGEVGGAAGGIDTRHITAQDPEFVLPQGTADLVARLKDGSLVLIRHVVLGRAVEACRGVGRGARFDAKQPVGVVGVEGVAAQVSAQKTVPVIRALLR